MTKKLSTKILLVTSGLYILRHIYRECVTVSDKISSLYVLETLPCPNNWIKTGENKCKNINNIGRCNNLLEEGNKSIEIGITEKDNVKVKSIPYKIRNNVEDKGIEKTFDLSIYNDPIKGDFEKCRWAKLCGLSWTGIDNLCV